MRNSRIFPVLAIHPKHYDSRHEGCTTIKTIPYTREIVMRGLNIGYMWLQRGITRERVLVAMESVIFCGDMATMHYHE